MKYFKNVMFVFLFLCIGFGSIIIAECVIPTTHGDEVEQEMVIGISEVNFPKQTFYVNEPLNIKDINVCLIMESGRKKIVDLKASNVTNFKTSEVGNFEMTILYDSFTYKLGYSVEYKAIELADKYDFDFEQYEKINKSKFKIDCLDFYDLPVKTVSFEDAEVLNLNTEEIVEKATAEIYYKNLRTSFDYSVNYFSQTSNYISTTTSDDCAYQITKFVPNVDAKLIVIKKIVSQNLIEGVYEFSLKRLASSKDFVFLNSKQIGKLSQDKTFTIFKDVLGNSEALNFKLEKGYYPKNTEPRIEKITNVFGLKADYIMNEEINFSDVEAELLLSDNTRRKVKISEENISNLDSLQVKSDKAKIQYYSFSFEYNYTVNFKKLTFYYENENLDFEIDSSGIFEKTIICYDAYDNPVAVKKISDLDVSLIGFDCSKTGQNKEAKIVCYGASLKFVYNVF